MPNNGDTISATKLGIAGRHTYIWHLCPGCQTGRWIYKRSLRQSVVGGMCRSCRAKNQYGEKAANWKGGRFKLKNGYVNVYLAPDNFFFPMVRKPKREGGGGYVFEHRLVMAEHLGRCLHQWETVHHLGTKYLQGSIEDKGDNRRGNLELATKANHSREHSKGYSVGYREGYLRGLQSGKEEGLKGVLGNGKRCCVRKMSAK